VEFVLAAAACAHKCMLKVDMQSALISSFLFIISLANLTKLPGYYYREITVA
jgi:hypothetical protein